MHKHIPFALPSIGEEEERAVQKVLRSGWITTGSQVREFEKLFAQKVGAKHAIAVNSCTAALHLSLLGAGVGAGDEVIVPTMTFTASAEVITYLGAIPVFTDCDPDTFLITPKEIEEKITKKTKAIIPVHYGGQACDVRGILRVARKHGLKVIWDGAHALPTRYKGRNIGSFGDFVCFSFYATKTITTAEGGMITTNDARAAHRIRIAALHGMSKDAWKRYEKGGSWKYDVVMPGYKYNLTDVAAAMGIVQLKKAELFRRSREKIALSYENAFRLLPEIKSLTHGNRGEHAWHLYVIELDLKKLKISRDRFIELLFDAGVGTSVHFIPLHMHSYWKKTYGLRQADFPAMTNAYKRIISLPIYPRMTVGEVKQVIGAIRNIVQKFK